MAEQTIGKDIKIKNGVPVDSKTGKEIDGFNKGDKNEVQKGGKKRGN